MKRISQKGEMNSAILIGSVALSVIVIMVLGLLFATKTEPKALDSTVSAHAEIVGEVSHEWGDIDIDGGNVEQVFTVKNTGDSALEINNIKTSCMCTEARVTIDGQESPVFGMHTRSGWTGSIKPGSTAEIRVVFDPLFHGPDATGPITRLVSMDTNDSQNPTLEFKLSGNVIKVKN